MEFKKLQIDLLVPAEYNPRKKLKPGDSEFEKIKNSINEFGYVDPVIVNNDLTVIGGHQRISVLKTLGYTTHLLIVDFATPYSLDMSAIILPLFLRATICFLNSSV